MDVSDHFFAFNNFIFRDTYLFANLACFINNSITNFNTVNFGIDQ